MRSCYFCHLPVGRHEAIIKIEKPNQPTGTYTITEYAHLICCETARCLIENFGATAPMTQPFPFTFKP